MTPERITEPRRRGRKPRLSVGDWHEVRRYREAGVSIERLATMWHVSKRTIHEGLAALRVIHGPEQLPEHKRQLVRLNSRRSSEDRTDSTPR
jgi:hypothetical protein